LLYKHVNGISKDGTKRTQALSEVTKRTHSKAVKLHGVMNLQYFAPAAFPPPKNKLRNVWL